MPGNWRPWRGGLAGRHLDEPSSTWLRGLPSLSPPLFYLLFHSISFILRSVSTTPNRFQLNMELKGKKEKLRMTPSQNKCLFRVRRPSRSDYRAERFTSTNLWHYMPPPPELFTFPPVSFICSPHYGLSASPQPSVSWILAAFSILILL